MTQPIDQPKAPREGESLDSAVLERYLKAHVPGLEGSLEVEQFPGGASNLTYLIRVGERELVLRRPPFGKKAKSAHDMGREYRILSQLYEIFPYCPRPLVYCEDTAVMDEPFYVMERLRGIILREDFPKGLELDAEQARGLCQRLIAVHAELHSVDYEAAGLGDIGRPEGYIERQIRGWSQRYEDARTDDAADASDVQQWLDEHRPAKECGAAIIHNDFKFDNVVLDPDNPLNIIGVLDWEMATVGDPLMDLGCSLAYWVQADDPPELQMIRMLPTHREGMLTRAEVVDYYARVSGRRLDDFRFYYTYGLFRLAVIVQQIYARYVAGSTRNPRFAQFGQVAQILVQAARRAMRSELR